MKTLALSVLPCAVWLAWFWFQDWYDREPWRTVILTFLLGAAATVAALVFNAMGTLVVGSVFGVNPFSQILVLFLVIGPVEEAVKMAAVLAHAYRRPEFNEPVDGVVYSAAAALGFAAAENLLYLGRFGADVFVVRGILSNPGHALFAAFWGLALSRARTLPNVGSRRVATIVSGWLAASLLHGLFDAVLTAGQYGALPEYLVIGIIVALMISVFIYVEIMTVRHVVRSPHRRETMLLSAAALCPSCGEMGIGARPCPHCGQMIAPAEEDRLCPACGRRQHAGLTVCADCGASLLASRPQPLPLVFPHLVRPTGDGREEIAFILDQPEVTVGKTLDNTFVIDDPTVSKHHARLVWHPVGNFVAIDLNSTNGTYVNGRRVKENLLKDGFEIRFGRARFIYRSPDRPSPLRAAAPRPQSPDPHPGA